MSASYTRSSSQSSTVSKVVTVTRKVQAELLAILDYYGYFSEAYAQKIISDIRVFIDEEAIDKVKFTWTQLESTFVLEELEYRVVWGNLSLLDDRPGGIRYRTELSKANFNVRIIYSDRWQEMAESERELIREDLKLKWTPGKRLDYSGGNWSSRGSFSTDDLNINRKHFKRS